MSVGSVVTGVRAKLAAGETVLMVNLEGANRDVVETLARFGADVAFVDCERTGIGLDGAASLILAARAAGIPSVVRSWTAEPAVLVQFLDRKADGIVVPHVDTPEDAAAVVETVRFACGAGAAERLVIVQIESREAAAAIDAIAAVDGIDAFLIGPNDLGYSMTGQRGARTPDVEAAIESVCQALQRAGRPFGMPMPFGEIERFQGRGATLAYYSLTWLLQRAMAELCDAVRR